LRSNLLRTKGETSVRLRTILLFLALLAIFSVTVGGSHHDASLTQAARDEVRRNANAQANTLANQVPFFLATNQKAVAALAAMRPLPPALASADPATLEAAHAVLDRFQQAFAASACYLMDREGTTAASSNRNDPDSFVGNNYTFRDYFQQAIRGVPTLAVARGVTS
jgi:C4-dicarboxylate-specific signal transduction histidine kinase